MSQLSDADVQRIAAAVVAQSQGILPHQDTSQIAAAAARTTVQEMMVKGMAFLDINMADSTQVEQLKEDLRFVRGLRKRCDRIGAEVTKTIVGAVTYGVMLLLVLGLVLWIRGQADPPRPPTSISK